MNWSRSNFSTFCVDLLSALEGFSYDDKRRPSFGMIFDSFRLDQAPLQPLEPRPEYPFLTVSLHGGGRNGEKLLVNYEEGEATIEYWVEVKNEGHAEANISDDMFKTSLILPIRNKALKAMKFTATPHDPQRSLEDLLNSEGLEIPFRLVYKAGQDGKELFAVEKTIKMLGAEISFV